MCRKCRLSFGVPWRDNFPIQLLPIRNKSNTCGYVCWWLGRLFVGHHSHCLTITLCELIRVARSLNHLHCILILAEVKKLCMSQFTNMFLEDWDWVQKSSMTPTFWENRGWIYIQYYVYAFYVYSVHMYNFGSLNTYTLFTIFDTIEK